MTVSVSGLFFRALLAALLFSAGGCALFETPEWAKNKLAPVVLPAEQPPIVSNRFELVDGSDVVGELQVIVARDEDTFLDIARAYDLGFDELEDANPGVDAWLPGAGTRIVLPTEFVLPDVPREGIVLNVGTKRLFYYPKPVKGQPRVVITHPVGIGREGWQTPIGTTKVVAKNKDPVWTVPASIRREHAAEGNPLPARVGPGPDNPLGAYAMRLGFPSYLIHGTNKPDGIGMRVSHGCVQLFPEDIESLFAQVPVGTPVRIINEPQLLGWRGDNLYLEVHPRWKMTSATWTSGSMAGSRKNSSARQGVPGCSRCSSIRCCLPIRCAGRAVSRCRCCSRLPMRRRSSTRRGWW